MPSVLALTGLYLCLPVSGLQSQAGACGSVRRSPPDGGLRQPDNFVPPFRCRMHQRNGLLNSCALQSAWARDPSCKACRVRLPPPGSPPTSAPAPSTPPGRGSRRRRGMSSAPRTDDRSRVASCRPPPPMELELRFVPEWSVRQCCFHRGSSWPSISPTPVGSQRRISRHRRSVPSWAL